MKYALALLMLAGCAAPMKKAADVDGTHITWVRAVPAQCANAQNALGCAIYAEGWRVPNCLIIMPEDAPDWVIAHEFKHCFGYEHGDK